MTVKQILDNSDKTNIAEDLSDDQLAEIGQWVCEMHSLDQETMSDWEDIIDKGTEIAKPELKGISYPWEGASNYKSPAIGEAVRDFGDRATMEILRNKDLVAGEIIGIKTPEKQELLDRIKAHMNYQINHEIGCWRDEQEKGFYRLAAQGAMFKKTFYDSTQGHLNTEWIGYPDFSVNNKLSSFDDCGRFTHIRKYTNNDVFTKVHSGEWIKFEYEENEGGQQKEDYSCFLECYCRYDIDDDGYAEPYVITVHEASSKVVRVAPRYRRQDVFVKFEGKVMTPDDAIEIISQRVIDNELMDEAEKEKFINKDVGYMLRDVQLVRIEAERMLTLYNFIHPFDGSLLGWGFLHLMSSPVKGVNKASNALFNAGDLANLQCGFLSKEHRNKHKGPIRLSPGQFKQLDIGAADMANSVFTLPIKEPSATLLQLNELLKAEVEGIGNKVNIGDALSPNVPAISVLGMLQEGIVPTSALIGRIINAMTKEFKVIAELNAVYTDPQVYAQITGETTYEQDYSDESIDLAPTANAQFSSQFQRMQLAQVQMDVFPMVLESGGNPLPIIRNYFDAIGSNISDEVFPEDGQMSEQDQQQLQQMKQLREAEIAAVNQQNQIMQAQLQLAQQAQDLERAKAQARIEVDQREQARKEEELRMQASKVVEEIRKIRAETIKTLEEAESEEVKNRIDMFQKEFDNLIKVAEYVQRDRSTTIQSGR